MQVDIQNLNQALKSSLDKWKQELLKHLITSKKSKVNINTIIEPEVVLRLHDLQKGQILEETLQKLKLSVTKKKKDKDP